MDLTKEQRDEIVSQAIKEIVFDRRYKQGKIRNWQKNENMYYGVKATATDSRANVDLARMQEFVHTLLSKIDAPMIFKYLKRKDAQLKRVKRLNALRTIDSNTGYWDIKDLVGKKQGIVYGRAIYCYYADSYRGYKSNLDNVDVYDYLIDPSGGGIDLEKALNMGRYGVVKSKEDLLDGVDNDGYDKDVVRELLDGTGNNTEAPQEETNKRNRMFGQQTVGLSENQVQSDNKYKFWEWYTTYYNKTTKKSQRYYLLLQERAGRAVKVVPLTEMFMSKPDEEPMWPFWSWAAFPDLTEFWTPSYCDYAREMFMAQAASVNQMLDNAEAINKPQKVVNTGMIENMAELKYRRDGLIKVKGDVDISKAFQTVVTPSITTPIELFKLLDGILDRSTGVTAQTSGTEKVEGKVGIYKGNQEASADRFGLLNKSYSFGYKRFSKLYENGVREHLTKKIAVDMIGPDGVETEEVSRRDIFHKKDDFGVLVEASNAEDQASLQTKEAKLTFLNNAMTEQMGPTAPKIVNPKKAFEIRAKVAGFEADEIKELMDTSEYGNQEIMSEAARDLESLLDGDIIRANGAANNAYKQYMVDWLTDHEEDITMDQFNTITLYIHSLESIIVRNETRALNKFAIKTMDQPPGMPPAGPATPGAPVSDQTIKEPAMMGANNGQPTI